MSLQTPTEAQTAARTGVKPIDYNSSNCDTYLKNKGCIMKPHPSGIADDDKEFYQTLLQSVSDTPKGTVFDEDALEYLNLKGEWKNETGITRMISQLVVPSAEVEMCRGKLQPLRLVESINEPWTWSTSLNLDATLPQPKLDPSLKRLPTPQPDYAVGFSRDAFTPDQLKKLNPYLGSDTENSGFKSSAFQGTEDMLFPFLTSECKCFKGDLHVARKQNAHAMARSLRGVFELFKLAKCQNELHRKVLGFSIIHNHELVSIYAHYVVIENFQAKYYQDKIRGFLIDPSSPDKVWSSHHFVMAVYQKWAPKHLTRLCSAINKLSDPDVIMEDRSTVQPTVLTQQMVSERNSIAMSHEPPLPGPPENSRSKSRKGNY
ncbi:hypothetical protein BO78DRAFT_324835 [Aspergillus sclerotiicarbonarius CBS 121057]|uniref:DUF7924 domain-containing protein n=1 Tax=Aspergillus sclerotiicarbonarius (strain CBS 121057 / IBT 28362) TaxID=1448318 RepID=A0A319DXI4_ASPSB|nr:hypothetical protein BO78DRAFT_324835 [Aspergillus sclerotiicarbonarius CBS 121057]